MHTHTNDFSGFLHSLPFSLYEHRTCYRMRVCGSDLHFTIQTIDIEIRVGFAQTHRIDGVSCNFKPILPMPHKKLQFNICARRFSRR